MPGHPFTIAGLPGCRYGAHFRAVGRPEAGELLDENSV